MVNPPAARSSLRCRTRPGPAFVMHYSQKAGEDLTAAVYSVGGTLDRVNMMFTRVGSSSFYCLTLPHGSLPSGFYTRHRTVMAKQVEFWSGLEISLSWFSTQWQWLASVTGAWSCPMCHVVLGGSWLPWFPSVHPSCMPSTHQAVS